MFPNTSNEILKNLIMIFEITKDETIEFWKKHLWTQTEVRPSSSIIYLTQPFEYDLTYHETQKIFLGIFVNGKCVGVNSLHCTGETWRSRGLIVLPEYRGSGLGRRLLEETIRRSNGKVWSIPKKTALQTYLSSGFKQTSDFFETETSEENCYVRINKTKEHLEQQ